LEISFHVFSIKREEFILCIPQLFKHKLVIGVGFY
jgi:hypothetical protein